MTKLVRNQESRYNEAALIRYNRSKFEYGQDAIFTGKMGDLIPFFCDPTVMPGDTFSLNLNMVARLLTPIYPIMTPLYIETFAFFVPTRLVWEHAKEFWGENPDSAWVLETEYTKPKLSSGITGGFTKGTIVDYLYGCRLGVNGMEVDALPVRAVTKCYNDCFRNQNLIAPYTLDTSDSNTTFDADDPTKGGKCYKIAKYGDLFTRSLPAAEKGSPIKLPLGLSAPVYGTGTGLQLEQAETRGTVDPIIGKSQLITLKNPSAASNGGLLTKGVFDANGKTYPYNSEGLLTYDVTDQLTQGQSSGIIGLARKETLGTNNSGAYADLTGATAATIDNLIEAFTLNNIIHRMAIGGSRYEEIAQTFWGTSPSDARMQRAEYLGGTSTPVNLTQIPQTGSSDNTSPQGNLAAFSHTIDQSRLFTKSFTEHGILLIFIAIRQRHSYSQGIERCYTCFRRYDNYMPPLDNLPDMAVKKKEIFAMGVQNGSTDEETFGFQEAWYWMRGIRPSKIMCDMRPDITNNMAAWHAGDKYQNAPVLSQDFIEETDEYLLRTLAVTENDPNIQSGQWQFATFVHGSVTRVMSTHSVPGLRSYF